MAENENVAVEETTPEIQPKQPAEPSKVSKFGAAVKEWFRKRIVKLKRNTKIIPYAYIIITMFIVLVWLFTQSRTVNAMRSVEWGGMAVFLTTLFSILSVAVFGSAFPKRKKVNIPMLCVLFVFLALVILSNVLYYIMVKDYVINESGWFNEAAGGWAAPVLAEERPFIQNSLTYSIVEMILYGIAIVLVATLPLYKKLIQKINTRKVIEENNLSENIDTSAEV